jgi:hypothetical protein
MHAAFQSSSLLLQFYELRSFGSPGERTPGAILGTQPAEKDFQFEFREKFN